MNTKKILLFIGLTFLVDWIIAAIFLVIKGPGYTQLFLVVGVIYMFVPMVMAIIIQKFIYKEPLKEPLGISFKFNRWFLVAWLLPAIIAFATLGVSLLLPGVEYSPDMTGFLERFKNTVTPEQLQKIKEQVTGLPVHLIWLTLLQGLVAGITVNAVAGFGEELGWRGFLQKELGVLGFWRASVIIGAIWGIWHAPLILQGLNYPQHPVIGVPMMIIWCILLAPIFSYVRLKSKSVIAAAIIHGSLNAVAGVPIMVIKGGDDLLVGITGFAGLIVLLLINICIFCYDRFLAKEPITLKYETSDQERNARAGL